MAKRFNRLIFQINCFIFLPFSRNPSSRASFCFVKNESTLAGIKILLNVELAALQILSIHMNFLSFSFTEK